MTVREIINKWDPYSLFPFAPSDEYEEEIELIEDYINKKDCNANELRKFLKNIFTEDDIVEKKRCFEIIAKRILD